MHKLAHLRRRASGTSKIDSGDSYHCWVCGGVVECVGARRTEIVPLSPRFQGRATAPVARIGSTRLETGRSSKRFSSSEVLWHIVREYRTISTEAATFTHSMRLFLESIPSSWIANIGSLLITCSFFVMKRRTNGFGLSKWLAEVEYSVFHPIFLVQLATLHVYSVIKTKKSDWPIQIFVMCPLTVSLFLCWAAYSRFHYVAKRRSKQSSVIVRNCTRNGCGSTVHCPCTQQVDGIWRNNKPFFGPETSRLNLEQIVACFNASLRTTTL